MGLGLGMPRNIPLYHSDFIFAAITEEFGLIFAVGLLAVYVLIIMRGLIVAFNARTSFHSLTAFGLVIMLGLQTMLIAGGNTKLLPLSGVTLPLVCYGGSSLVSTFFSIGRPASARWRGRCRARRRSPTLLYHAAYHTSSWFNEE